MTANQKQSTYSNRTFTIEEVTDARNSQSGLCLSCGAEQPGVEPDAREYTCESCDEDAVFGAEEIMLMGLVE